MADRDTKEAEALLSALNRSAERLQTLWFTFLGLTIYFVITALTTTHRMLLLDELQSLPIVNLKVPLLPFFIIAPLFYVVLHFYMLMMLVLLARSATVFEDSLARALPINADREQFRMRAENALFLQLLIGAREERQGANGRLLSTIAIITLALAPVATLIIMQMQFLPYHHFKITWWHRALVGVDVLLVLFLWRGYRHRRGRVLPYGPVTLLRSLRASSAVRAIPAIIGITAAGWLTLWEGRWAGEPGIDPVRREHSRLLIDRGWFADRLYLRNETIVGQLLFEEKQRESISGGGSRWVPTRDFRGRNFAHADFSGADLRGVSFSDNFQLRHEAVLIRSNFRHSLLQGADFERAQLHGADFAEAQMQGVYLGSAEMYGANLRDTKMQGAYFNGADMVAVSLARAQLQGADLTATNMKGADVRGASLQGADLTGADVRGANFSRAQIQGATFARETEGADLSRLLVFGATIEKTIDFTVRIGGLVSEPVYFITDIVSEYEDQENAILNSLTSETIDIWINESTLYVNDKYRKWRILRNFNWLRDKINIYKSDNLDVWREWQRRILLFDPSGVKHSFVRATLLGDIACGRDVGAPYIALSIMFAMTELRHHASSTLNRLRSGRIDYNKCPGVEMFTEDNWHFLVNIASRVK